MRLNRKGVPGACRGGTASLGGRCIGRSVPCRPQALGPPFPRRSRKKKCAETPSKGTTDAVRRFIATSSLREMPAQRRHRREAVPDRQRRRAPGRLDGRKAATSRGGTREVERREGSDGLRSRAHRRVGGARSAGQREAPTRSTMTTRSCRPRRSHIRAAHAPDHSGAVGGARGRRREGGASGAAFLEAHTDGRRGRECKMAEGHSIRTNYERGFHGTGTLGVFGAAAAAGS